MVSPSVSYDLCSHQVEKWRSVIPCVQDTHDRIIRTGIEEFGGQGLTHVPISARLELFCPSHNPA